MEYHAMLAKVGVHHYNGSNVDSVPTCGVHHYNGNNVDLDATCGVHHYNGQYVETCYLNMVDVEGFDEGL